MTRATQIILWIVAGVAVLAALVSAWNARSASLAADKAVVRVASLAHNLAEIETLRTQKQTALLDSPPTESMSSAVRVSLKTIGLPDSVLRSLTGSPDEALSGQGLEGYRRLSVTLQLTPITTKQLGQFLAAWRAAEPAWLVTRIDLSHSAPETDANSTYDAHLTLATTFVRSPVDKAPTDVTPSTTPH